MLIHREPCARGRDGGYESGETLETAPDMTPWNRQERAAEGLSMAWVGTTETAPGLQQDTEGEPEGLQRLIFT